MFLMWICHYKRSWCALLTCFYVALISGTTPRGDTGGGQSSACKHKGPWIPASLHLNICQNLQLLGPAMGREPCYLEQRSFCTDTLVMLMFDNKRSVIKLETMLCGFLLPPPQSVWAISIYRPSVFLRKTKHRMGRGNADATLQKHWRVFSWSFFFSSLTRIWVWALLHVSKTTLKFKKPNFNTKTNLYI